MYRGEGDVEGEDEGLVKGGLEFGDVSGIM